ncbi:VCBS domain-containing protein, partial [Rhizobium sp. C4]|uniref:VCBS domain-containing protein n=1 Tax=Rhizobium sp. C4 TaxID=1349800 RepID=UPI001E42DA6F
MGIVLKVVHADNSVGTIELGSDSKVVFKPGDRVDVKNIKNLKDVEVDKDGNVVLTFPDGKVVLSNLPKEQLDALIAQLPPDDVSTASNPVSGKAMTGLLLLSLQSMLKTGGGLEFNAGQNLSGNAVKLDFGASQTSSDTKTSPFASLAPGGISLSASFVSVINGKEEATSVEDTITAIKASLTVTNPVLKDVAFVEQSAVKGDYGAFSISRSGDWTYQLNNASQKVQALSAGETVTETFTVVSSDGSAASNVRVVIAGTNDAPVLAAGRISTTEKAASASLDLSKLASDIDNDDDPSTLKYSIVSQPDHGSALISGTKLTFAPGSDFADLHAGETLTETIMIQVTDSHGASADNVVTVTVSGVADAPVLRGGGFSTTEDESKTMALSSFVVSSGVADRAIDFTITSQPEASTATIVNGNLVFTPGRNFQALEFGESRQVEVGLRGTNAAGLSTDTTVRYTVVGMPDKPIPSLVSRTVDEDSSPISVDIMSIVSDRSHNPDLTFVSGPVTGGGQVSLSQTGILTFDPNGAFNNLTKGQSATVSLDVRVESASSNTVFIVPVEFTVTGADDAPVLRTGAFSTSEDESKTMALSSFVV